MIMSARRPHTKFGKYYSRGFCEYWRNFTTFLHKPTAMGPAAGQAYNGLTGPMACVAVISMNISTIIG